MAKFSVDREDDGEGPSSMRHPKRRRSLSSSTDRLEEGDSRVFEEEDDDGEEDEYDPEPSAGEFWLGENSREDEGDSRTLLSRKDGSLDVTLTDPDVLDCALCLEPLTSPVFQCENGHIACSSCCQKISNKCPSCSMPIGYNRCRAIEKVLESVRVACPNAKYGCKDKCSYHEKNAHEKACTFFPYLCPFSSCSYLGSFRMLLCHLKYEHRTSTTPFKFNFSSSVLMYGETEVHLLKEEKEGIVFVLRNERIDLGNKIKVSCSGPSACVEYLYDIVAKSRESSLKLKTSAKSLECPVFTPNPAPYLLVPRGFFDDIVGLNLEVSIWRTGARK